jgi:lipopolysaccharide transport system ATP-binding protein
MGTIQVSNLGKAYKINSSRWHRLAEWLLPFKVTNHTLRCVLTDINFTVQVGEALGIIGINGAGKSTLLKLITGTSHPTTGGVQLSGSVAALLELGMGFHPDFSGRQNVYMAGQLLGLTIEDIDQLMPAIESFAEIGSYIDQPVRVYSSGMQVRLAFSLATARRPDILIVDEALSVGDTYFQQKCFERIKTFRSHGSTLLLVSHDKQAIQNLCTRAILLNGGKVELEGAPEAVMDYYNALLSKGSAATVRQSALPDGRIGTVSGSGEARFEVIELLDHQGRSVDVVDVGQTVRLKASVRIHAPIDQLVFGFSIKDRMGQTIFGTNTALEKLPQQSAHEGQVLEFTADFQANLGPGHYSIQTALVNSDTHLDKNYEWRDLALLFQVVNMTKNHFTGITWIETRLGIN